MAVSRVVRKQILHFAQIVVVFYTCIIFVITYRLMQGNGRNSPCTFIPESVIVPWSLAIRVVCVGQFVFAVFALVGFARHNILLNYSYEWNGATQPCRLLRLPHIRLVIVTTGKYGKLVRDSIVHHMHELVNFGWPNFEIVVLTEKYVPDIERLAIEVDPNCAGVVIKQVVVPPEYRTLKGTLYKARNLQYAQQFLAPVKPGSWQVHLDEDARIQTSAVHGMADYMENIKSPPIGQGAFAYGWDEWSWWTLPSNAFRSGNLIFSPQYLMILFLQGVELCHHYSIAYLTRRPPSLTKGGMFIIRADLWQTVSFDLGPHCSVTEDLAFTRKLAQAGVEWGWVHGVVTEQMPIKFNDYIKQRAMWIRGALLTLTYVKAGAIPFCEMFSAFFFWQSSSLLGIACPLWFMCQPLCELMPIVDDVTIIVVACYTCSMLFGLMFCFRLSFSGQMFWMVAHLMFPFAVLILVLYVCWIDLFGFLLGTVGYLRDLFNTKAPSRQLTVKIEKID